MVKCPYKNDCTSYPYKCDTCRHNTSKKKDYYEPDYSDLYWYPSYPRRRRRRYPGWTWDDYLWCGNDDTTTVSYGSTGMGTTPKKKKKDHYRSK